MTLYWEGQTILRNPHKQHVGFMLELHDGSFFSSMVVRPSRTPSHLHGYLQHTEVRCAVQKDENTLVIASYLENRLEEWSLDTNRHSQGFLLLLSQLGPHQRSGSRTSHLEAKTNLIGSFRPHLWTGGWNDRVSQLEQDWKSFSVFDNYSDGIRGSQPLSSSSLIIFSS